MVWTKNTAEINGAGNSASVSRKTRSGQVSADVGDTGVDCPRCGTRIVPGPSLSLESHMIMDCPQRSDRVKRVVARVVSDARKDNLDPLLILRMEMESVLIGDLDPSMDEEGVETDSKYNFLPDNFTQNYLNVGRCSTGDILEMFDIWSEYIERSSGSEDLIELIDKFEDEFKEVKAVRESHESIEYDRTLSPPNPMILNQIESEMETMSRLSPCNRDMENILRHLGLSV